MIWISFLITLLSLGLIIFNVQPLWVQYLALIAGLSLFVMLIMNRVLLPARFGQWLKRRGMIFASLFFIVMVSVIARRHEKVIDLSPARVYSLRDQTIEWLAKITEPIEILIFLSSDDKTNVQANWLQRQINKHTRFVRVQLKNINKEVLLTKRYQITRAGETVLRAQEQWIKVKGYQEEILVPGLMKLLSKTSASLCFLTGHGEPDIVDESDQGLSTLKDVLERIGYRIQLVALDHMLPQDVEAQCGVLFIVSPRTDFLPIELNRLEEILSHKVLPVFFALDPFLLQNLVQLLEKEGLVLSGHFVMNESNLDKKIPVTDVVLHVQPNPYYKSSLVQQISGKVYLPDVQEIRFKESGHAQDMLWEPLIQTPITPDYSLVGDKKIKGPFSLAVTGMWQGKPLRIVFGTGRGFRNRLIKYGANENVLLLAVSWLLQEERHAWIYEPFKETELLDLSETEKYWLRNLSIYGMPLVVFLITFIYWLQRRWRS